MRRRASVTCRLLVVGGAAALALAALAPGATAADPVTLRMAVTQPPSKTGLNPYLATAAADYVLLADQYDQLVEYGPNMEPVPGLAERWEILDGGTRYVFHMRQGVHWQDGQPFTAEDARFTLQYIIDSHDPAYKGPQAPDGNDTNADGDADNPASLFDSYLDLDNGFENTRIKSIEAPDDKTLVITTSVPISTIEQMAVPIFAKHIWQDITFAQAVTDNLTVEQAVGTGPFILREWTPSQSVVLDANKDFWGGAPHIDRLVYQIFGNDEAKVNALTSGDVDIIDSFPPTMVDQLRDDPEVTVNIARAADFHELGFNSWDPTPERFVTEGCSTCAKGPTTGSLGNPWLTKPGIRAALAGLVDKKRVVSYVMSGYADPGISVVSPLNPTYAYVPPAGDPVTFPDYAEDDADAGYKAAHAAAKQRFQAVMEGLGFTDSDGNGILNVPDTAEAHAFDPNGAGKDWSLRLFAREDHTDETGAAELIRDWFVDAGVQIEYQPVAESLLTDATYPQSSNADYDMYLWHWGPDPDPNFILSIFNCNQINGWQDANYCDPAYDELYGQQNVTTDIAKRTDIVKRMEDKLYHDAPYSVVWYENTLEAWRKDRFEGLDPLPASGGSVWSSFGLGPYGSRTTVGPIGAAGAPYVFPSPAASLAP